MIDLLTWCDTNLSILKSEGIDIINGLAKLPTSSLYSGTPSMITPFSHRGDIPPEHEKDSLIAFFASDSELFPRLETLDSDIETLKKYGGICGFDLSPSVGMLRPRQMMSLMISSIYNCRCAVAGIKVLPNARTGDLGTIKAIMSTIDSGCSIITGELGCRSTELRTYGLFSLKQIIQEKHPETVFVYGGFSAKDASYCASDWHPRFAVYPDRRSRMRNHRESYQLIWDHNVYEKQRLFLEQPERRDA